MSVGIYHGRSLSVDSGSVWESILGCLWLPHGGTGLFEDLGGVRERLCYLRLFGVHFGSQLKTFWWVLLCIPIAFSHFFVDFFGACISAMSVTACLCMCLCVFFVFVTLCTLGR